MDCKCKDGTRKYIVPDDLKLTFNINCEGFNQDTDPWTATFVKKNGKSYVCDKRNNTTVDGTGQWYLLLRTRELGPGMYDLIVDVDIPDSDFDGYRHEVYEYDDFIYVNPRRV